MPDTLERPRTAGPAPPHPRPKRGSRWLLPLAGLLGVLLAASVFVAWSIARAELARQDEAAEAERAAAAAHAAEQVRSRDAYRTAIDTRLEAIMRAGERGRQATVDLHAVLVDHLTGTDADPAALDLRFQLARRGLEDAAASLRRHAHATRPRIPAVLQAADVEGDVVRLVTVQERTVEVADAFEWVARRAEGWVAAVAALQHAAANYVALTEGHARTSDPGRLRGIWTAERDALVAYREVAAATAAVAGLEPLAGAYLAYIDANIGWADEAVALLDANDLDGYNRRLEELFGADDPFGFRAAATAATEQTLGQGVLAELDALVLATAEFTDWVDVTRLNRPRSTPDESVAR